MHLYWDPGEPRTESCWWRLLPYQQPWDEEQRQPGRVGRDLQAAAECSPEGQRWAPDGIISQYLQLPSQKGGKQPWEPLCPARLSLGPGIPHTSCLLTFCPASCSLFFTVREFSELIFQWATSLFWSTQFPSPITVYSLTMELFISKPHFLHVCFASFHSREISFIFSKQFYCFLSLFTKVKICSHLIERGGLYKQRKETKT